MAAQDFFDGIVMTVFKMFAGRGGDNQMYFLKFEGVNWGFQILRAVNTPLPNPLLDVCYVKP